MKYRYVYIDKIGRYYLRARPYYSFGSTLHQVLQEFHREGGTASAEEMAERYQERWIPAGYETEQQAEEYRAAGQEMVHAYHAAAAERPEGIQTLLTEKQIKADMGPFLLVGRIDRVDRHQDGSLEIVDYKSGRLEVTAEEVAGDLAMNVYQLILRLNHPGIRVFATIYCLRSGVQASAELSGEDADEFRRDITALGEEMLNRDFEAVRPVRIPACDDCDFLRLCERYWRSIDSGC